MWLQVIFDLPVRNKNQRRAASKFREVLLDSGFEMFQYSVYMRVCADKQHAEKLKNIVRFSVPLYGKVSILTFTDKQFEKMEHFFYEKEAESTLSSYQLDLF